MKKLLFFIFILQPFFLFAQNAQTQFINYTIDNGLSQSVVRTVYVDESGIEWIGTDDGLNSYDGFEFEVFKPKNNNLNSISATGIRTIHFEDSYNNIWITTSDGLLNKFNLRTKLCENYGQEFPDSLNFKFTFKRTFLEDQNSDIWITNLNGLYRYKRAKNEFIRYSNDSKNKASLSDNNCWGSYLDSKNNLWIGTNNGLCLYLPEKDEFKRYFTLDTSTFKNTFVCFIEDKDNNLYTISRTGIYSYNQQTDDFIYYPFIGIETEQPFLQDCLIDEKGYIWIATNYGLFQFDTKNKKIIPHLNNPQNTNSISANFSIDLCITEAGALWIGTLNGLNEYNYNSKDFTAYFQEVQNDFSNIIMNISEDYEHNLWIVNHRLQTVGGRLSRFNLTSKEFENMLPNFLIKTNFSSSYTFQASFLEKNYMPYKDRFGNIWFGSFGGGVSKIAPKNKNFETYIANPFDPNAIPGGGLWGFCEDNNGLIWCSIIQYGLIAMDKKTGEIIKKIPADPNNPNGLVSNWVTSISKDKSGDLWLTTSTDGLNKLNPNTLEITHFKSNPNDENSIRNNRGMNYAMIDENNNLWTVIGRTGIEIYDIDKAQFSHIPITPHDTTGFYIQGVSYIFEDSAGDIWFIGRGGIQKYKPTTKKFVTIPTNRTDGTGLRIPNVYSCLEDKDNNIWFATTGHGICKYDINKKTYTYYDEDDGLSNNFVYNILEDKEGNLWLSTNLGLSKFNPKTEIFKNYNVNDGLQSNEFNANAAYKTQDGKLYFGGIVGISAFYPKNIKIDSIAPHILLKNFKILGKIVSVLPPEMQELLSNFKRNHLIITDKKYFTTAGIAYTDTLILSYRENRFSFEMVGFGNMYPAENVYKYKLDNFEDNWNFSNTLRFVYYNNLPPGEYTFIAYSGNPDGVWSKTPVKLFIKITPPFWKTWWFRILISILILSLIYFAYRLKIRQIKQKNEELEKQVVIRTQEITEKNEELQQQQQEILAQAESLEDANVVITKKNEDIMDSINYASTIQKALLPSKKVIDEHFPENFILFRPRDIVSGDFYWFKQVNDFIVFAAADCTGHGVPGAFMSMLGIAFLNEIVRRKEITTASQVLNLLRSRVKTSLQQTGDFGTSQDGMDIGLCVLDKTKKTLDFAGAYRPLYLLRKNTTKFNLQTIKGDRMPIGVYRKEKDFVSKIIELQDNDTIYLFSDGYTDQFSGNDRKKFTTQRFKDLIVEIQEKSLNVQGQILNKKLEEWKGHSKQLDDVLVVGMKIIL